MYRSRWNPRPPPRSAPSAPWAAPPAPPGAAGRTCSPPAGAPPPEPAQHLQRRRLRVLRDERPHPLPDRGRHRWPPDPSSSGPLRPPPPRPPAPCGSARSCAAKPRNTGLPLRYAPGPSASAVLRAWSITLSIPSASGNRRSRPARRRYVLPRLPWAQGPRDLGALAVHRGGGAKTARPRHLVCGRQPQRRPLAVRRTVAGAYRHHRDPGAARRNRPRHAADPTLDAPRRLWRRTRCLPRGDVVDGGGLGPDAREPRQLPLDCPVPSPCLGGLGSDRPVRVRPSLQVLLDSALPMRRPRPPRWPATWEPLPRPHRRVRDGSLRLHTTRADAISGSGGRQRRKDRSAPA